MVVYPVGQGFFGSSLPRESRRNLAKLGRTVSYHPGQVIYRQGAASEHVRVLLDGSVKLTASARGRETLLEIRNPGDLLGEREVLYSPDAPLPSGPGQGLGPVIPVAGYGRRAPRNATATALRPVQALVIPGNEFTGFMRSEPGAMAAMARDLEGRLTSAERRISGVSSESANRRLARALLSLSAATDLPGVGQTVLELTQGEMASWIGASRETVERVLRDWRGRGIVETRYRGIVILRLGDLMRIAGSQPPPRPETDASLRGFR
jgi:CRP/FNR family transcriptional regulator, cyclic AMP receptor protein